MNLDRFRSSIAEAFAEVPYPGDSNITNCSYKQSLGFTCEECEEIADYFREKSWRGHRVKDLRYHSAAFSFFTPEALHYYLPAFVMAVLEDPETADVIYDGLVSLFARYGSLTSDESGPRLSSGQRQVMIEYFQDCLAKYGEYGDGEIARAIVCLKP